MPLPVNINELLSGKIVESERIEFREGWNPERTLRTICAFANDHNNWGGGYIIIGISEKNGIPVLPPYGIAIEAIDGIQQELNQICRRIIPNYFPIIEPIEYLGKMLLILWCPGGSARPYKAPEKLSQGAQYYYFLRRYSATVFPTRDEERDLFTLSNQIPFDDRINTQSLVSDLDISLIRSFLREVGSDLEEDLHKLTIEDVAAKMNLAEGSRENFFPKNVGLLFFAANANKFFPNSKIEIVTFDDDSGTSYSEKSFSGGLHIQLRNALEYLRASLITEKVIKNNNRAEVDRFFNYPYEAVEEALCNAVYHRGYDNDSVIEVRVYPSKMDIISFPGPLPPLNREKLINLQFDVRRYRNRRIGEFLKELHLTEGRATGIPTIIRTLEKNKSPKPKFDTDEARSYFKITFEIHPFFKQRDTLTLPAEQGSQRSNLFVLSNLRELLLACSLSMEQAGEQAGEQAKNEIEKTFPREQIEKLKQILSFCSVPRTRSEILKHLNLTNIYKNYTAYLMPLMECGLLRRTIPDKPRSPAQKYLSSDDGKSVLRILI